MFIVKENFARQNTNSCDFFPRRSMAAIDPGKEIADIFSSPAISASLSRPFSVIIILLLVFFIVRAGRAQEYFDNIATAGQVVPGVRKETKKSNQSQVIWYQGYWWGIFRAASPGTNWFVYKYNSGTWTPNADTGISNGSEADAHLDEANGKLYVLVATTAKKVCRFSYSGGNWVKDSGFPTGTLAITPAPDSDHPPSLTRAADGDLFIFWVGGNTISGFFLWGLHSTNQGVSWTGPFSITNSASGSITDAMAFRYLGNNYMGLMVGEGSGTKRFFFRRLADSADPTVSSNWVAEDLPLIPSLDGDGHLNIVRDADHNLYAIGKKGSHNSFYLFKRRSSDGQWSWFDIRPDRATRPALGIDEANNSLVILGTVRKNGTGELDKIQYTVLDKDNLQDVMGMEPWTPALEDESNHFSEVTVSYQILDNSSNLMVCGSRNSSPGEVWYNLLDLSDISLPVFMAFFNATTDAQRIHLEWGTHSEVNNWEWIILRREGEEGDFRELARLPGSGTTNFLNRYTYIDERVQPETVYYYRLANVDFDGTIHYYPETVKSSLAPISTFTLYPNYPNPFNAQTTVRFEIGEATRVQLDIFDVSGRRVRRLFQGYLQPGSYNYIWDGRDDRHEGVASGVYFLNFSAGNYFRAEKMVLSK